MINILDKNLVNKIAAGEVVERPASVVKELVENSLDAEATEIRIFIKDFGTSKIQVSDNGKGISKSDFNKLFHKHATSKISVIEDLDRIESFGFRGEALASIASVSEVNLSTRGEEDEIGTEIRVVDAKIVNSKPSSITSGTEIVISNLFGNIPARKKFLKSKATENKTIQDILYKFILANPSVNFYLDIDGVVKNFPAGEIKSRIASVLKIPSEELVEVFNDSQVKVSGYAIHPKNFQRTKASQFIFVNGRPVNDLTVAKAAIDGYDTFLMKHQYPGYVLFLSINPLDVDVNVHPRKTEVRFASPSDVYKAVRFSINKALVNALRKETLGKLSIEDDNDKDDSTLESAQSNGTSENIVSDERKDYVSDFENFLKTGNFDSGNSKDQTHQQVRDDKSVEAMLFSKEIVVENTQPPSEELQSEIFLDLENATQLLNSYIVTSNGKDILIIDQHAASERFFYEKYLNELKKKKVTSKVLLFPESVTLDEFEVSLLEKNFGVFENFGFRIETFGSDQIKITEVPDFVKLDNFAKVLHKIIEDVLENSELSNVSDRILHEISAILACHTAVRFGDKLNRQEIVTILKNLSKCEDPYNCPHGRPIIQDFSKYDIEKKFKRCSI